MDSTEAAETTDVRFDRLRRIATYQRWVLFALLANVAINISILFDLIPDDHTLDLVESLAAFSVLFFSIYVVFKLASQFYSTAVAVVCAIVLIIPLVGLIVLLVVSQKATSFLQQSGYKVGLMGINPNRI